MGLYDEVVVEYPLPDGWEPGACRFQSKDISLHYYGSYVLRADGTLWAEDSQEAVPFHGALRLYTDNLSASGPLGVTTPDDAPPWTAEYVALYDHGQLVKLEGQRQAFTTRPHLTRAAYHEAMQVWWAQRREAPQ